MKSKKNKSTKKSASNATVRNVPAAIACTSTSSQPSLGPKVVIRRREFVGTATNGTNTGFALTPLSTSVPGYDINPASGALFPWLAQIAPAFERFRFNRLSFEFVPGQSTSTAGRFYAAVDYDYDDNPANSKPELMGNITAVESSLWSPCSMSCDSSALNRDLPYRYVSATSRSAMVEARTSYSGFLMVAFDTTVTNCLMDIWVNYEVEFVTPVTDLQSLQILPAGTTYVVPTTHVTTAVGTKNAGQPAIANGTFPFGNVSFVSSGSFGTPVFSRAFFTGVFEHSGALDLKGVLTAGALNLMTYFNVTGAAPNSILGADQADVYWSMFDSKGTYLTDLHNASSGVSRSIGPVTGAGGSVSSYVIQSTTAFLQRVLALYPTLRYIAPLIVADVAYGAGNTCWGFSCEK